MQLAIVKKTIFANFGVCYNKDTIVEATGTAQVKGKITRYSIKRIDPRRTSNIQLSVNASSITILPNVEWQCIR
jgi:hypothetical protein